jgi:hypothetical protein
MHMKSNPHTFVVTDTTSSSVAENNRSVGALRSLSSTLPSRMGRGTSVAPTFYLH